MRTWNHHETPAVTIGAAWKAFAGELGVLSDHGTSWAARLAEVGELAENLASFCFAKLK